jgi:predicted HNH restriction endonuclease
MSTKEQQQQYRDRKSGKVITPTCSSCSRALRADNNHPPLCATCWRKTPEGARKLNSYRKNPEIGSQPHTEIVDLHKDAIDDQKLIEGSVSQVTINSYERNPKACRRCIEHYGASCYICSFNFGKNFGEIAKGFIHVHHLNPISEIQKEYEVDPIADLRPVCPNCHAVIHLGGKTRSIEEVKLKIAENKVVGNVE